MKRILFVLGFVLGISSQTTAQIYMLVVEDARGKIGSNDYDKKITILNPRGEEEKSIMLETREWGDPSIDLNGNLGRWKKIQKEINFIINKGYKLIDFEVQNQSRSKHFSGVWFFDKVK